MPVTARPTLTANVFTSTFNAPTLGKYDFTNVAANQNQTVITMTSNSIYIIERVCFSMTIPEANYQESIDLTIAAPRLTFKTQKTGHQIFPKPLPFVNYLDNLELLLFVPSNQSEDKIQVTFEGVLNQVPDTVGIAEIKAMLQMNIYEVQNNDWIRRFYNNPGRTDGDLEMRGPAEGTFA